MTEYICKCGKKFKKSTDAGTTGYRMPDYGPTHECYGCHFVIPVHDPNDWRINIGYECRASEVIRYYTSARIGTAKNDFSVAHIYTLDVQLVREIIAYYNTLEGKESLRITTTEFRASEFRNDGRLDIALSFQKNRSGTLAKTCLDNHFFDNGSRKGISEDDEHTIVINQIKRSCAAVRPKKETNEIFMLRARKCARCGGILTSTQAVEDGMGHVCKLKANGDYGIEKPLDGQISLFAGADENIIDGGK